MKFGLPINTIEKAYQVFNNYPEIEKVIIYGSRAIGNYREGSDIDITLIGDSVSESIRSKVWLELDDLNTPYLIDLSVFHQLTSSSLRQHINREGKVFYSKNKKRLRIKTTF